MTAEEKTALARFLDLTDDFLKDGYARDREDYAFENDRPDQPVEEKNSLPLAYTVDESGEDDDVNRSDCGDDTLEAVAGDIAACKACGLARGRTLAVPGEGVPHPLVMVIGEAPGADEDRAGRPFVGKAGQLLDRMLASIGLFRDQNCYIANMVKCRPPENRDPAPDEIAACYPYLSKQIELLNPRLILCVGRVAAQSLLKTSKGINALRGEFAELKNGEAVIPVLSTFHPSAVLRDDSLRRPAWEDLKLLRSRLESINKE